MTPSAPRRYSPDLTRGWVVRRSPRTDLDRRLAPAFWRGPHTPMVSWETLAPHEIARPDGTRVVVEPDIAVFGSRAAAERAAADAGLAGRVVIETL